MALPHSSQLRWPRRGSRITTRLAFVVSSRRGGAPLSTLFVDQSVAVIIDVVATDLRRVADTRRKFTRSRRARHPRRAFRGATAFLTLVDDAIAILIDVIAANLGGARGLTLFVDQTIAVVIDVVATGLGRVAAHDSHAGKNIVVQMRPCPGWESRLGDELFLLKCAANTRAASIELSALASPA